MKKIISLLIALTLMSPALATVKSNSVPTTALEESVVTIKGKKLNSGSNPFTVTLKTADGQSVDLPTAVKNKGNKADILMPTIPDSVSGLVQVVLEISGGNVPASSPESFALILTSRPDGIDAETSTVGTPPVLADTTDSGLSAEGPQGPQGPQGEQGEPGNEGPQGPTGPTPTTLPGGAIVGPVNQAKQVTQAVQDAITTLNNLVMFGKTGVTTTAKGPLAANEGFIGNLLGNVNGDVIGNVTGNLTGNVTGNLTGSVLTSTQNNVMTMTGLKNVGTTGVNTTFAGPVVGSEGFLGNLTGNLNGSVLTATQNNIMTMTGLKNVGTTGVNTTFAGPIVADEQVFGDLNGTVLTATQNEITTMDNLVNVGTTGVTTTFAGPINAAEGFTGPVTGMLTGNVTGDVNGQLITATQNNITTLPALVSAGTSTVNTVFSGPVVGNETFIGNLNGLLLTPAQPNVTTLINLTSAGKTGVLTEFAGSVKAVQGFIGNLTGNLTGNVSGDLSGNAQSATNAVNVTGAAQPGITSLGGLALAGSFGNTVNFSGSVGIAQNLNVTGSVSSTAGFVGDLNGSAAEAVSLVNGATSLDIAGGDSALLNTNGDVSLTLPSVDGELALVSYVDAADAALDAQIGANANGTAANTAAIAALNGQVATNTSDIVDLGNDISALEGNNNANGSALIALSLTDATETAALTVNGTDAVVLQTNGSVTLDLPDVSGKLALTSDLPISGIAAIDILGGPAISALNTSFVKLSDSVGGNLETINDGVDGQRITILFLNTIGLDDSVGNLDLSVAGLHSLGLGDTLELIYDATTTTWYEVSRSAN